MSHNIEIHVCFLDFEKRGKFVSFNTAITWQVPILLAQKEFGSQATANTIWALAVLGCKDRNMTEPLQDAAVIASFEKNASLL